MHITVNGEVSDVPEGTTVAELLVLLRLDSLKVALERNGEVAPRAMHHATKIEENDRIEIIHFIGGG